jgi:hypothetical protein
MQAATIGFCLLTPFLYKASQSRTDQAQKFGEKGKRRIGTEFLSSLPLAMSSFKQLKAKREERSILGPKPYSTLQQSTKPAIPAITIESEVTASPTASTSSAPFTASTPLQERLKENNDLKVRHIEGKGRGLFWEPQDGRRIGRGE